jgi:hypothetical protein
MAAMANGTLLYTAARQNKPTEAKIKEKRRLGGFEIATQSLSTSSRR